MIIKKILNNNVVITTNDQNEEIVVMGKGLAYSKRPGDVIDDQKINKIFELSLKPSHKRLMNMLKEIPIEYMEISDQVIQKAKKTLKNELDDSLYISLTDHIHTSVERYREGTILKNQLLMEIKNFYREEYELGLWTLELIQSQYGIKMDENEAGFIAMHIVSSEIGDNMSYVYEITNFIQEILNIVKEYFHGSYNENSLSYHRFITHLRFFGLRIILKDENMIHKGSLNNDLLNIMKEKYMNTYLCALDIQSFIEKKYKYYLNNEEVLFLTIHIARIISNK